ncbi:MAG: DNA repair protein RecN, partial [Collinsella intestinalis]
MPGPAGVAEALAAYRDALARANEAARELERVERASRTQGSRLEEARFALERFPMSIPSPASSRARGAPAPRRARGEPRMLPTMPLGLPARRRAGTNTAIAELSRMARVDVKLSEFADQLSGAAITVEDAAAELRRYRDSVDFDPAELAAAQERYSAFKGLLRQWGPHMEDVFARRDEAAELLSLVDDAEARVRRAC